MCRCGMLAQSAISRDPLGLLVVSGISQRMPAVTAAFLEIVKDVGKKSTEREMACFPDYLVHFQALLGPSIFFLLLKNFVYLTHILSQNN